MAAARITQQKIGGILQGVPWDSVLGVERPRIQIKAGDHLQDPYRQGQLCIAFRRGVDCDI
jgi:hypothetical protein